jgi:hypothetical protein
VVIFIDSQGFKLKPFSYEIGAGCNLEVWVEEGCVDHLVVHDSAGPAPELLFTPKLTDLYHGTRIST